MLRGHGDVVKAVTFLPEKDGDEASYLISGANDKSLIVWKSTHDQTRFKLLHTSRDHAGAINCISAVRVANQPARWLLASGAADATINIWSFEADKLELLQTIKTTPKFFPLCLSLSWLGDDGNVLALAAARHQGQYPGPDDGNQERRDSVPGAGNPARPRRLDQVAKPC